MTKRLTASEVKYAKCPSDKAKVKLSDGDGLTLVIRQSGTKSWIQRYSFMGEQSEVTLGKYPDLSLSDARSQVAHNKSLIANGKNPQRVRKAQKLIRRLGERSFQNIAIQWWERNKQNWSDSYTSKVYRWISSDLSPIKGLMINEIKPWDIKEIMLKIEASGHPKKTPPILAIMNRIFAFAMANELTEENPAQNFKLMDIIEPLPKVKHFASIKDDDLLGKLINDIDTNESGTYCSIEALKLLPRLFLRPNNVRALRWSYIDFKEKLIRLPEEEMKSSRAFLVPMSEQVFQQLTEIKLVTGYSPYVFPNAKNSHKPISKNVLRNRLLALGYSGDVMTAHGFRSTASTILNEKGWDNELVEVQLAHLTGNQTSRSYNQAIYLKKRRKMMQFWSDYLDKVKGLYIESEGF